MGRFTNDKGKLPKLLQSNAVHCDFRKIMISKKVILTIVGAAISACIVASTVIILCVNGSNGNDDPQFKTSQIELSYGQTFALADIVAQSSKYEFKFEDDTIAVIENDKIITRACGSTDLQVSKGKFKKFIPVRVYAEIFSFASDNIILHVNGRDNRANFSFWVNNRAYSTPIDVTANNPCVNIEGSEVVANAVGTAQLSATILGKYSNLTVNCTVNVKQYVYASEILKDDINININQSIPVDFVAFQPTDGEKVNVNVALDENHLRYENNVLTALKVGTTRVTISADSSKSETLTETIAVNVSPALLLDNYTFKQGQTLISKLYCSNKADSTRNEYTLELFFNKPLKDVTTDSLKIEGLTTVNIETSDNKNIKVTFTKGTTANITLHALDPNTQDYIRVPLPIETQQYISNIDYILNNQNTETTTLYLFNEAYLEEANNDGYYNSLSVDTTQDVAISLPSELATINGNTIKAVAAGEFNIILAATDGSGVTKQITITNREVIATEFAFTDVPTNIYLYETVNVTPTISPSYALIDFQVECDRSVFERDSLTLTANACGSFNVKITDGKSNIAKEHAITIHREYVFISNDKECTSAAVDMSKTFVIEICKYDFNTPDTPYVANILGIEIIATPTVEYEIRNNRLYFINCNVNNFTLQVVKNGKILAQLEVYNSNAA